MYTHVACTGGFFCGGWWRSGGDEDDIIVGNSRNPTSPRTGFTLYFLYFLAYSLTLLRFLSRAANPSIIATGCRYTHYTVHPNTHAEAHIPQRWRYARRPPLTHVHTHTHARARGQYTIMHVHILYYYA